MATALDDSAASCGDKRHITLFTQFRTENRFTLFLELL
jgi:hypothetical protein